MRDLREALERLLEHDPQLQARERRAQAEVPTTGAEGLVLWIALDLEAVGILVARLVAVGGDVPHDDLLALLDLLAVQLDVARGRAAEMREGREHAQRLLDGARDQRTVVEQLLHLLAVFHQRAHAAAVSRLRAVVAGGDEQEEAHHDLVLLELLAVDLGVDEHGREVVGRALAPFGDHRLAAFEDLGDVFLEHAVDALRVEVFVVAGERRVHQSRPGGVVLGRDPHEAADHARDGRLRDVADEVAALLAAQAVEQLGDDRADVVLVRGDPLGREAGLEQRLQTVVLGRVHADEHRLRELEREHVRDGGDAGRRGVGLPVARDRVDVIGGRDRPEAPLLGVLGDARGPVDRALAAHLLEELERRAVLPQRALCHQRVLEIAANGRHLISPPRRGSLRRSYWPSGQDARGWPDAASGSG